MNERWRFGDVVLVPFPFTDQGSVKQRPAIVISAADYGRDRADVILMPVTSRLHDRVLAGETVIVAWQAAGLLKPSLVKPVIATLEQALVRRRLGVLDAADQQSLRRSIGEILG